MAVVTGNRLKSAIQVKVLELDAIKSRWDESLYVFENEKKTKMEPEAIACNVLQLEKEIAILQEAQNYFNLNVVSEFEGEAISLQRAIRLVGGHGRVAKMWGNLAKGQKKDRWDRNGITSRDKDKEYSSPTFSQDEALRFSLELRKKLYSLKEIISWGNSQEVEIDWLDEILVD